MKHSRRGLVITWSVISLAAIAGVIASQALLGPRDDNDPAFQRPGMLDLTTAPFPAPPPVTSAGRRAVVFFVRDSRGASAVARAFTSDASLRGEVAMHLVVAFPPAGGGAVMQSVPDPKGSLAAAFGLRTPRDGGPAIGYALVDSRNMVRYVTLDPEVANNLSEVRTLIEAMP